MNMGWLRLVGSLKFQVSLAEYSLFYRALLQKRPIKEPTSRSHPISNKYKDGTTLYIVTHNLVMSHMNESRQMSTSHVPYTPRRISE